MSERWRLIHAGQTDVGRRREHNEDAWDIWGADDPNDQHLLLVVSDGVGGQQAGELASARAVETLINSYKHTADVPAVALLQGFLAANAIVAEEGKVDAPEEQAHMRRAATLVAVAIKDDSFVTAHVGDSRAYLLRNNEIRQLTSDHTLAMEWVRQGRLTVEQAEQMPQNNIITRAIGRENDLEIEIAPAESLQPGDRIMLCSDGLTKHVKIPEIATMLAAKTPKEACADLIALANQRGGTDNITVVIALLQPDVETKPAGSKAIAATMPVATTVKIETPPLPPPASSAKRWWPLAIAGVLAGIVCVGTSAAFVLRPAIPALAPDTSPSSAATAPAATSVPVTSTPLPRPTNTPEPPQNSGSAGGEAAPGPSDEPTATTPPAPPAAAVLPTSTPVPPTPTPEAPSATPTRGAVAGIQIPTSFPAR